MKTTLATIAIIIFLSSNCFSQNDSTLLITVNIKVEKEYELTRGKEAYATTARDYGYDITSDSVNQKYYDITVEIKNTSVKPIHIWLMTCSWEDNFIVNNNYMSIKMRPCDHNFPTPVEFKPGESKVYQTTLMKSIKFDYPCQNCIYGPQVETTKLGLIIIDDIFKNKLGMFGYDLCMEDKSKWRIVWSNPLYLFGKQPEPVRFDVLKPN